MNATGDNGGEARNKSVYIVEDDADVANVVRTVLRDFGFEIVLCRTASDLFHQVGCRVPDLCIVDLGLPDMDGMDVVRRLKEKCNCGVLILTGRDYVADRILGLELGADDYVTKPFDPRELVARVRSILRRIATHPGGDAPGKNGFIRFDGWRFHADNNLLTAQDGREWSLSTAEAQLLKVFLSRPNRILTREQLLNDRDVSPYDRSIDVRISRLRRKLEIDPQNPKMIRTVYGAGYLFSAAMD
jgi:DNA-binding response OmpR family regulator